MLVPFMDTTKERRPFKRPLPTAFMLLAFAALFYLTWESVVNHDWEKQKIQGAIVEEVEFDMESEGYQIYAGLHVSVVTAMHSKVDLVYHLLIQV